MSGPSSWRKFSIHDFRDIPGVTEGRRLAVGGMAELFLADQNLPDGGSLPVVVKRLLPDANPTHARLFLRETEVLALVDSPRVVRLLGHGPNYLLMEAVDGHDLETLLAFHTGRGRVLPLEAGLAVIEGLLEGLADLHEAVRPDGGPLGAVHRDVTPSNVLVSRQGDVKIADLGVVHVGDIRTEAGFRGTLVYMSPEQLQGRSVDRRSDLYAAGLVAYEVLTGVAARPQPLSGLSELLEARSRLPVPPSTLRPELPRSLDVAILEALAPDPGDRPLDARAFLESVRRASGIDASPETLAGAVREVFCAAPSATFRTLGPEPHTPASPAPGLALPSVRSRQHRLKGPAIAAILTSFLIAGLWLAVKSGPAPQTPEMHTRFQSAEPAVEPTVEPLSTAASLQQPERLPVVDALAMQAPLAAPNGEKEAGKSGSRSGPTRNNTPHLPDIRLEIRPDGHPLHVHGAGSKGLAPIVTGPILEKADVLTLRGGPEGLPAAVIRVTRRDRDLVANIGTAENRHFPNVRCGGRDLGSTPVLGVPIRDELHCTLSADEGNMSFSLAAVRQ